MTAVERLERLERAVAELALAKQGSVMTDGQFAARWPALSPFALARREELQAQAARPEPTTIDLKARYRPITTAWQPGDAA